MRFGDQAYVQTLGTPMGVAASVNNSHNFLCTFDELNIDYLVSVNKFEEAARWSLFWRAVDDMYSGNNPHFVQDMAVWGTLGTESVWDWLSYDMETVRYAPDDENVGLEVNMCDITIKIDSQTQTLTHELYDKTHHLGELSKRLPRYPNARSQIPNTIKAGILTSQLSRIYMKSSSEFFFKRDSLRMILRLIFNGISVYQIRATVDSWEPRQTCHLPWTATHSTKTSLLRCITRHRRDFGSRADADEIQCGISNPALEAYILELINE